MNKEVSVKSGPGDKIPGSDHGFNNYGNQASSNQNQTNLSGSSQASVVEVGDSSHACAATRQDECHKLCPSTRATILSPPTDGTNKFTGVELQML